MTTHTPGPWGLQGTNEFGFAVIHGSPENHLIADNIRQQANARLAAAAPELLAACNKVLNHWGDLHPKDRQQLRDAVAKTKGTRIPACLCASYKCTEKAHNDTKYCEEHLLENLKRMNRTDHT